MNVIAFAGSPRRGGNSDLLLEEAVKGAGCEVRVFRLSEMKIGPCEHCDGCIETGRCIVEDEMGVLYDAIREADRIIFSTPVFFMGVTAQAKAMIDRTQAFWCEKYLLKKPLPQGEEGRKGLLLMVGGMKNERGVECAGRTMTAFFRTVSVDRHEVLSYTGVDAKGAVKKHPTALKEAFEAGRKLIQG